MERGEDALLVGPTQFLAPMSSDESDNQSLSGSGDDENMSSFSGDEFDGLSGSDMEEPEFDPNAGSEDEDLSDAPEYSDEDSDDDEEEAPKRGSKNDKKAKQKRRRDEDSDDDSVGSLPEVDYTQFAPSKPDIHYIKNKEKNTLPIHIQAQGVACIVSSLFPSSFCSSVANQHYFLCSCRHAYVKFMHYSRESIVMVIVAAYTSRSICSAESARSKDETRATSQAQA